MEETDMLNIVTDPTIVLTLVKQDIKQWYTDVLSTTLHNKAQPERRMGKCVRVCMYNIHFKCFNAKIETAFYFIGTVTLNSWKALWI
jgi:hypothetical protein